MKRTNNFRLLRRSNNRPEVNRTSTFRLVNRGRIRRAARAAMIATLSVGITCAAVGVAQAQPAAAAPPAPATTAADSTTPGVAKDSATPGVAKSGIISSAHGIADGLSYFTRITPDGSGVATTLDAGTFTLASDAAAITVADGSGKVITTLPLSLHAADHDIPLAAAIEDQGATLTLHPVGAPLQDITSQDRWNEQVQRGTFGALIGAAIGGLITIPFWIFILPPLLGIAIGAAIGFLSVGGQPLIDAGIAYFTGQP